MTVEPSSRSHALDHLPAEDRKDAMGPKKRLSVAVVGHHGSGKSTLLGHLLWLLGFMDQSKLRDAETATGKRDKRSATFSMTLDQEGQEWEQGCTIECKLRPVETTNVHLTLVDTPGKVDFQRALVSGLSGVDAIVVVVNAAPGAFEAGMAKGGQTREAALIAYVLGLRHVILAVSHMDALGVAYSKKRFEECKADVLRYLKRVGFAPERVVAVPVSGLRGDNVLELGSNMTWFKGVTLMEALEVLEAPKRLVDRPLRLVLFAAQQVDKRLVCQGRVEYGTLTNGMTVTFMPGNHGGEVALLEGQGDMEHSAPAGSIVRFVVKADPFEVGQGTVVSDANNSPSLLTRSFVAQIIYLNAGFDIGMGWEFMLDVCTACVRCRMEAIEQKIERRSGKVLEEHPSVLKPGDVAFCRIEPLEPVCIESATDFPLLGRLCIRHDGHVIAVGLVKSVCT